MKSKRNPASNQLPTYRLSDVKLIELGKKALTALNINNNNQQFDALIAETELALNKLDMFYGKMLVSKSTVKSKNLALNNDLAFAKANINKLEGAVRSVFGKNTPEYKNIFPNGLTEFTKATRQEMIELLNRCLASMALYPNAFSEETINGFTTFRDQYAANLNQKYSKTNEAHAVISTKEECRTALIKQLNKNLHLIAIECYDVPERFFDFFDKNMLVTHQHATAAQEAAAYSVIAGPLAVKEAGITFTDESNILFFNDSDVPVKVYTGATPNTSCPDNAKIIEPGEEVSVKAYELGTAGNRYLFVKNEHHTEEANVEISMDKAA